MGQYWKTVNLDKREFISPHQLGCGSKLGEQLGGCVGDALVILCAAMPERRGGGDFDYDSNFYGPERDNSIEGHGLKGAPVVETYNEIAKRTIGRWAGDRIALVGDYAEDGDIATKEGDPPASKIYSLCRYAEEAGTPDEESDQDAAAHGGYFKEVTRDVARVIEHERGGRFVGAGWKRFLGQDDTVSKWVDAGSDKRARVEGKITKLTDNEIVVQWPQGVKTYPLNADHDFF